MLTLKPADDERRNSISGDQLRAIIERVESVEAEIKSSNEFKSEIYKEAKSAGFDPRAIKEIVKRRRADPAKASELAELVEIYEAALG